MLSENQIRVMFDQQTIENRIREIGEEISRDYEGEELVLVCVLKGGVMFMTQLSKSISIPMKMDFIMLSSYGNQLTSTGKVKILQDISENLSGKHALIVEDIVDTGRTLNFLKAHLLEKGAESVEVCAMLDKPSRRVMPVELRYRGFEIEDEFVLGYGLDYAQWYRNLPYIAYVRQEEES